ncbi:MAG: hypothetical protein ACI8TQ_001477 [Planctomycetota bacterium]|jgi:hypothetical protein
MTPLRSRSGKLTALIASLLLLPAVAQAQSDLSSTFQRGVDLLRAGNNDAALAEFQSVLASDPSHAEAYELWKKADDRAFLDLLSAGDRIELIGKRLMELSKAGRAERRDDKDAIEGLLKIVYGSDARERRQAIFTLNSMHGEFAVPYLARALADQVDGDSRVDAIHTLTEMGTSVVLPLIQMLKSDDAFLRRQVAYTLGYIEDSRACPALAHAAASDTDGGVQAAAAAALARIGGDSNAAAGYIAQGDGYRGNNSDLVGPGMRSSVIWSWNGSLQKSATPDYLYADRMAEAAYYDALMVDSTSTAAIVGIAGAAAGQSGSVEIRRAAGADVSDVEAAVASSRLAATAAGSDILDAALTSALDLSDETGAAVLCRMLGSTGTTRAGSLQRALASRGAVSSEAALALGNIALRTGQAAEADAIEALANAAGRSIMRVVGIIDSDEQRVSVLTNELQDGHGALVYPWSSASVGLAAVRRSPGFDLLIVSDQPEGLTAFQVLSDLKSDPRLTNTALLVVSEDADRASELFGELAQGVVTTSDLSALGEALSGEMSGDRARAMELAIRSAETLAALSGDGASNLSQSQASLADALDGDDAVVGSVLVALGRCGDGAVVEAVMAVLTNDERTEALRVNAANALAGIFGRTGSAGEDTIAMIIEVATSAGGGELSLASAGALGQLPLDDATRAELLSGLRTAAN